MEFFFGYNTWSFGISKSSNICITVNVKRTKKIHLIEVITFPRDVGNSHQKKVGNKKLNTDRPASRIKALSKYNEIILK